MYSLNEYHVLIVYLFHEVIDCLLIFYLVFLYQHSSVITVCTFILFCSVSGLSINVIYTFIKKEWGKTVWKFFKNFNRITIWLSNSTSKYISKKKKEKMKAGTKTDICTLMFIAALYTVVKRWKQHKHPSVDEWINSSMW